MPVCILGMHRSGTSPITRMLNLCGLYLGPDDQIMNADPEDNPEGYWENQLITNFNDELLAALDSNWHTPSRCSAGWSADARFDPFRHRARGLMADMVGADQWGWKDPRNSLTLEFWLSAYPDLKLVLCLRNPLEVARSLSTGRPLRTLTYEEALNLWADYHERIVMSVDPDRLIVTHYDTYFYDAPAELRRVTELLGITPSLAKFDEAIASLKRDTRRNAIPRQALAQPEVPTRVAQHYKAFCMQSGAVFHTQQHDTAYQLRIAEDALTTYLTQLRHATQELRNTQETVRLAQEEHDEHRAVLRRKDEELATVNADRAELSRELEQRDAEIAYIQSELAGTIGTSELPEALPRASDEASNNPDEDAFDADSEWGADTTDDGADDATEQYSGVSTKLGANIATLVQQLDARTLYIEQLEADRAQKQRQLDAVTRELDAVSRSFAVRLAAKSLWRVRRTVAPNGTRRYALLRVGKRMVRRVLGRTPGLQQRKAARRPKPSTAYSVSSAPTSASDREAAATILCTIVSKNYISQARTLMRSVRERHPDIHLVTLLVDEVDGYFDPETEPFETLPASVLGIPNWRHFALKYTIMELNTAVKPYMLEYLFERYRAQKIIYLDPDIIVYGRLDALLALLEQHCVVLTPHLLDPLNDTFRLSELDIMRAGTYNLGFIALARTGQWRELLHWWQQKLYEGCIVDFERGYFVDQRWMDLVPGLFEQVYVLRDPGYNIAYWNFKTRDLQRVDGGYSVDGQPLVFFHFSGFSVHDPAQVSKHQDRFVMKDLNRAYRACFADYRERLLANGFNETKDWPYAYGCFSDGAPISDLARRCLLQQDPAGERWPDPFDVTNGESFRQWLTRPSAEPRTRYVSPYVLAIHSARPDLRGVYPYPTMADDEGLARWFISREQEPEGDPLTYHLVYINPVKAALGMAVPSISSSSSAAAPVALPAAPRAEALPHVTVALAAPPRKPLPAGVNVIGYIESETGVGQQARNFIASLRAANIPFAVQPVAIHDRSRKQDHMARGFEQGTPYAVNLFVVNADQTFDVRDGLEPQVYTNHHNIAYWSWELAAMPQAWSESAAIYDEIWTPSTFVQSAVAALVPRPASAIPPAIERSLAVGGGRATFGLPDEAFVVLFAFDAFSVIERKNPWGVIAAFEQAFSQAERRSRARLVMKVSNLEQFPRERSQLRTEMRRVNGVLIDSYLDRLQVNALINACDVYISLHRSEGYGLSLAEAMYFGKPTIATAYSGNVDFMLPDTSFLVPFRLVELERDYPPYQAGNVWANPDIQMAASMLRHAFERPDEARERGARAATYIREHNSPAATGSTLSLALSQVWYPRSSVQPGNAAARRPAPRRLERPPVAAIAAAAARTAQA